MELENPLDMPDSSETNRKLKNLTQDLRRHAKMQRIKVSEACRDIMAYCDANQQTDMLIFPARDNHFRNKKTCNIL